MVYRRLPAQYYQIRSVVAAVGDGKAAEGSKLIMEAVLKEDSLPIWFVVNAVSNTLAQALHDLRSVEASRIALHIARL